MLALCLIGILSTSPLPETLHHKLPNTLEEAKIFGKEQTFWFIPKKRVIEQEEDEIIMLELNIKTGNG